MYKCHEGHVLKKLFEDPYTDLDQEEEGYEEGDDVFTCNKCDEDIECKDGFWHCGSDCSDTD